MVELARDPHLLEHDHHARAQVGVRVAGRRREVALLGAQRVAEVAAVAVALAVAEALAAVPEALRRVDLVEPRLTVWSKATWSKTKNSASGPDEARVGDARLDQISPRPSEADVARVASSTARA